MKIGEPVVKRWYEALDEGKMLGLKCGRCGAVEFPPVYCCNKCSSTDMEWTEVSGKAKMLDFVLPSPLFARPENASLGFYCYGSIELEEGSYFSAIVIGVSKKNKQSIVARLPVPVKAEILQRDGFKTIAFRVVE